MKRLLYLMIVAASVASPGGARAAESIVGTWATATLSHIFRVAPCGHFLCVYLAHAPNAHRMTDQHNPDPAKRRRKLAGITLVSNGAANGKARWEGNVYNWEDGKTYFGYVEPVDSRTMKASGCLIGHTMCLSTNLYRLD